MKSLLSACANAGIAEWVYSNDLAEHPLAQKLKQCPQIRTWNIADARGATAFAMARSQVTERPVAIIVANTQEARLIQPLLELAIRYMRPLLLITLCSEEEATAALAQSSALDENAAEESLSDEGILKHINLSLPCPSSELPALNEILQDSKPLQIFLSGTLDMAGDVAGMSISEAPTRPIFRGSLVKLSRMVRFHAKEGLVLMLGALEGHEQEPALWIAQTLNVPVIADAASGLREELAKHQLQEGDRILKEYPARSILRLGEVPTSPLWAALEDMPLSEVYSITRTGISGLERPNYCVQGDLEQIMKAVGEISNIGDVDNWTSRTRPYKALVEELLYSYPESAASLIRSYSQYACMGEFIYIGSKDGEALWNRFAQNNIATPSIIAQRGSDSAIISQFFALSAEMEVAYALVDCDQIQSDLQACELIPQLTAGKRIIAAICTGREDENAPSLKAIAENWKASYICMNSEMDLDSLDELSDDSLCILEIKPYMEQSTALITRLMR